MNPLLLFKYFAKAALLRTPYEFSRRKQRNTLPSSTFENIIVALAYYGAVKQPPAFVQVGACDGVSGDSVHRFVKRGCMKALLVEPMKIPFDKLRQTYEGVPNVTLLQTAIGKQDGEVVMYKAKNEEDSIVIKHGKSIDAFSLRQLASFQKAHLIKHGLPEGEIEAVKVPCLTLSSLMTRCGFNRIDVLSVDTEGFDADIVEMALQLPEVPECINFENIHLKPETVPNLFNMLRENGYVWTHDNWNTMALHAKLLQRW